MDMTTLYQEQYSVKHWNKGCEYFILVCTIIVLRKTVDIGPEGGHSGSTNKTSIYYLRANSMPV